MTPGSANLLLAGGADQYQISRSLRFRSSASAYLTRTPASSGNRTTWTVSFWMKRGAFSNAGGFQNLFLSQTLGSSTNYAYFGIDLSTQGFTFEDFTSSVSRGKITTVPIYRDPSAWYHVILAFDTTNATAADRIIIYVNGIRQTLTITTQIAQNQVGYMNTGSVPHFFCTNNSNPSSNFFDGYLTEINFIDGQALTPSSFGETDTTTGVWKPKRYSGTYGTNGFYLNFSDNSAATAAAIGKDSSGNGNNWTPNNISLTSGVTYDSMIDTPTPYDDGGNGRGNYCVLNPLTEGATACINGNLTLNYNSNSVLSTFGVSSGKWYYETTLTTQVTQQQVVGLSVDKFVLTTPVGNDVYSWGIIIQSNVSNGQAYHNGTTTNTGVTYTAGDVVMVAFDMETGKIWFGKNGTWLNSGNPAAGTNPIYSNLSAPAYPTLSNRTTTGGVLNANFGQRPFAYTPPSGYKALNTQNLSTPTIVKGSNWFDVKLDTGANIKTTAEATFTGDELVWIKDRANANNHQLIDTIRGTSAVLQSNTTSLETTYTTPAGNSVGWVWKKGATPGFDIVAYTGPSSSAPQSVAHSLGVKPDMMIVKARNLSGRNWAVYHKSLGATQCLRLNLTNAVASVSGYWNNTEPTSTVFTVGTDNDTNANTYNYVAYLFAEVAGFSKFGSYAGNGSTDGPFVYCGFRPRFILSKNINQSTGTLWHLHDTARNTYNYVSLNLSAHASNAEYNYGTTISYDITANGFKVRGDDYSQNGSGNTHIFAAFAENPFKYALAR